MTPSRPSSSLYPSYTLSRHSREVSNPTLADSPFAGGLFAASDARASIAAEKPVSSPTAKTAVAKPPRSSAQRSTHSSSSSSSSLASFRLRQPQAEHTLSQVALEAETERRVRRGVRRQALWRWLAWLAVGVLEGWTGYCTVRYLVAFIIMDSGVQRTLNLTFFVTSLLAVLALPLLFLTPFPFNVLALTFSALLTLLTAASQLAVFKSWEDAPAPTGFSGRCGWGMDASWGRGTVCDGWQWGGWVGVLCARLAGSFLLLALVALAHAMAGRLAEDQPIRLPSSPTIPYYSGNHHRSTSSSLPFVPPSHEPKPPPTAPSSAAPKVYDYYTPALWSEEDRGQRREMRERAAEELRWKGERDELLRIARTAAQRAAAFSALVKNGAGAPATTIATTPTAADRTSYLSPSVVGSTPPSSSPRTVQASRYLRSTLPAPLDLEAAVASGNPAEPQGPLVIIRSPSQPTVVASPPRSRSVSPDTRLAPAPLTPESPPKDLVTPETTPTGKSEHSPVSPPWTTPDFPLPPPSVGTARSRSSMISVLTRSDTGAFGASGDDEHRLSVADSIARSSMIESLTGSDLGGGPLPETAVSPVPSHGDKLSRRWSGTDIMRRKAVPSIHSLEHPSSEDAIVLDSPPLSVRSLSSRPASAIGTLSHAYTLSADPPFVEDDPLYLPPPTMPDTATPVKRMSRPKSLSPTYAIDDLSEPSAADDDDELDDFVAPPVRRNAIPPSRLVEHRLSTLYSASEGSLASRYDGGQARRSSEADRRGSDFSGFNLPPPPGERRGSQSRRGSEGERRGSVSVADDIEEEHDSQ